MTGADPSSAVEVRGLTETSGDVRALDGVDRRHARRGAATG